MAQAKARIWPWLSYVCRVHSTAAGPARCCNHCSLMRTGKSKGLRTSLFCSACRAGPAIVPAITGHELLFLSLSLSLSHTLPLCLSVCLSLASLRESFRSRARQRERDEARERARERETKRERARERETYRETACVCERERERKRERERERESSACPTCANENTTRRLSCGRVDKWTVLSGQPPQGSGFRVAGFGFRVQGSGFRVQGPHTLSSCSAFSVSPRLW